MRVTERGTWSRVRIWSRSKRRAKLVDFSDFKYCAKRVFSREKLRNVTYVQKFLLLAFDLTKMQHCFGDMIYASSVHTFDTSKTTKFAFPFRVCA